MLGFAFFLKWHKSGFDGRKIDLKSRTSAHHNGCMNDVTQILMAIDRGEPLASNDLLPLVYEELRKVAAAKLANERAGLTLVPTALVHEAYLRLVGNASNYKWKSRGQFFAAAAEAMRRILIDAARRRHSQKRGGEMARRDIDVNRLPDSEIPSEIIHLDESLARLEKAEPEIAQLVKLRYFAGLTSDDAAQALGIAPRTADSWWAYARAWLLAELKDNSSES
jgi:RNA polymerase sigma factor (TIGR02999 family)